MTNQDQAQDQVPSDSQVEAPRDVPATIELKSKANKKLGTKSERIGHMPNLQAGTIVKHLQSGPESVINTLISYLNNGMAAVVRGHINADRGTEFNTFEDVMKANALVSSNRGEALAVYREAIDSFLTHCASLGRSPGALMKLKALTNAQLLMNSTPKVREKMIGYLGGWVEALSDADVERFTPAITKLDTACQGLDDQEAKDF